MKQFEGPGKEIIFDHEQDGSDICGPVCIRRAKNLVKLFKICKFLQLAKSPLGSKKVSHDI